MGVRVWGWYPSYVFISKWPYFNSKEENFQSPRTPAKGFFPCQCGQRQAGRCAQSTQQHFAGYNLATRFPSTRGRSGLLFVGTKTATLFCCPHVSRWEAPWRCGYNLSCPALSPQLVLLHHCNTLYTGSPFHGACFCHILANCSQTMLSCYLSRAFLWNLPN